MDHQQVLKHRARPQALDLSPGRPWIHPAVLIALLAALISMLGSPAPVLGGGAPPSKKILAVFAHPDDDITIGPLLAHYAAQGVKVYLVVVTSGQDGVTPHAKIPAGPQLGAVREAESRAACKAYGIEEPFLFGEQDGSLASMQHHDQIIHRLGEIIQKVQPSVIITFGPDGVTGHADHRAVSNMVTEIFQMFRVYQPTGFMPQKLYYVSFPESLFGKPVPPFPGLVASVDDGYITTIIPAKDGLAAAALAEECYKSQYTPEVMKAFNAMMEKVLEGNIYLRLALSQIRRSAEVEHDLYVGVP
jgi:LmbE family N-acetylglucosaminyl deacetylase